jgi:hypothetical protein
MLEALPVRRAAVWTLLLGAGIGLGACTSMGGGSGFAAPGNEAVNFSWKSDDGSGASGQMSATLADGTIFSGDYLEITRQAANAEVEPEWNRWDRVASDLATEEEMPAFGSSTLYSGRVLANLRSGDGQTMRCRFHLNVPTQGMGGGGQGKCDLPNGGSVDAVFPRT